MQQHLRSNRDGVHNSLSNMLTTICRSWFKKRPNSAKDFVFVSERAPGVREVVALSELMIG